MHGKSSPSFANLAERLYAHADGTLLESDVEPAPPAVLAVLADPGLLDHFGALVEPFDGGAIVWIGYMAPTNVCVVGLLGSAGPVAAVITADCGEADALYAGLATQLGVLGETCASCSAPIPSVYQYCAECT